MKIEHEFEVQAPAELLWQVIVDLPAYPKWNPFVVACRSSLDVGAPIQMRVRVFESLAQPQTEIVLQHQPGRLLSYGLPGNALGVLKSQRSHRVCEIGRGRSRYCSSFELSGWLSPLVGLLLGRKLRRSFGEMSEALVQRAQSLARA